VDGRKRIPKTLIFVNDNDTTMIVGLLLLRRKYLALPLQTGRRAAEHDKLVDQFTKGALDVLVCVDNAFLRETIVPAVYLINYNLPTVCYEEFERRFARVGRDSIFVNAISFFDSKHDLGLVKYLKEVRNQFP
jgi:superfamily II DNA/RNA helicase